MVTTGYTDTFNRTVSGGLGVATSGQTYSIIGGVAAGYSVAPSTASIAISTTANFIGWVDRQTSDFDATVQVALSSIPATNLATAGLVAKASSISNYYYGSMRVATGGGMSLKFQKTVAGALSTIADITVSGLTYVANTFYNLRFSVFWSRLLQTNILSLKLWAIGSTEPGGWMAQTTDASLTDYTAGTLAGIIARDESTTLGTETAKFQALVTRSNSLPMPATTDTMCADPSVTYPKQTTLQSLAVASDVVMAALDPRASLAALFPRVRVSKSNFTYVTSTLPITAAYDTTEFNISTNTNLGYDPTAVYLTAGVWFISFEIRLAEAVTNYLTASLLGGPNAGQQIIDFRSNAAQTNDLTVGGTGHFTTTTYVTDPVTATGFSVQLAPVNTATTYTIVYMALSAIKISDYYT